jgi:muramidase (phage lysozyme)
MSILIILGVALLFFGVKAFANINENPETNVDTVVSANDEINAENQMPNINTISPFLDVIAFCEGANYNTLFGGNTFSDYSDHPANLGWAGVRINGIKTTASGRYQITQTTFNNYKNRFGITDFSPISQDEFASQLVKMRGAYIDAVTGNFISAMKKCVNEWESFKRMFAGNYPITLAQAQTKFLQSGGIIV